MNVDPTGWEPGDESQDFGSLEAAEGHADPVVERTTSAAAPVVSSFAEEAPQPPQVEDATKCCLSKKVIGYIMIGLGALAAISALIAYVAFNILFPPALIITALALALGGGVALLQARKEAAAGQEGDPGKVTFPLLST
jgi:hypothetical protein